MKIPKEVIDEIKRRTDIIEIISEYVKLKPTGRNNYKGLCPFHDEKTPSFSVSSEGLYHCFGCGESGNSVTFLEKYLNFSFYEAMIFLANRYGVNLQLYNEIENSDEALFRNVHAATQEYFHSLLYLQVGANAYDYFLEREITTETMAVFGLGYSPNSFDALYKELKRRKFDEQILIDSGVIRKKNDKIYDFFRNRAMFPIKDFLGRTIAFGARKLAESDTMGKYINSADSLIYDKKNTLFGLYEAKNEIRKQNEAIIVEGYIDVISLHQAGIKNAVAPCGTALTKEQLNLLKKHTNVDVIYFMFDGDTAGQAAAQKSIIPALELGFDLRIIALPENEDPDSLIRRIDGIDQFEYQKNHARSFVDFICERLQYEQKLITPAEKSSAIKNIINTVLQIPDKVQHKFYIDNIKDIFGVTDETLKNIYLAERNKIRNKKNTTEYDTEKNISATEYLEKSNEEINYNIKNLIPEERELLHFALQNVNNFSILVKQYSVSEQSFLSDLAKLIFEIIFEYWDNPYLIQCVMENDEIPKSIISIISQLKLSKIEVNYTWQNFSDYINNEETDSEIIVAVPLAKLRMKIIEKELANLKEFINSADEKLLLQWKALYEERLTLNDTILKYE